MDDDIGCIRMMDEDAREFFLDDDADAAWPNAASISDAADSSMSSNVGESAATTFTLFALLLPTAFLGRPLFFGGGPLFFFFVFFLFAAARASSSTSSSSSGARP